MECLTCVLTELKSWSLDIMCVPSSMSTFYDIYTNEMFNYYIVHVNTQHQHPPVLTEALSNAHFLIPDICVNCRSTASLIFSHTLGTPMNTVGRTSCV